MPYYQTPLGYRSIYEVVRGVVVTGGLADLARINWGEFSANALDIAQEYVLSLPKEWLPYIQAVVVNDYFAIPALYMGVFNTLPPAISKKLVDFTEALDWKKVTDAPIPEGYNTGVFSKYIHNSSSMMLFVRISNDENGYTLGITQEVETTMEMPETIVIPSVIPI
ncbi:MAG: hypothetical protein QXL94_00430 [Candidatus Parvarchaeum sp.]